MKHEAVLLDTSFFLRFLNEDDPLYKNADGFFRYFIKNEIAMVISTISIAEYCVGGTIAELPLKNLKILPFNLNHAKRTGEFAKVVFTKKDTLKLTIRRIIPNDSKLFAQADSENSIKYYLSSDSESYKIYSVLKESFAIDFQFIDLQKSFNEVFGVLDL
ncbi:MAG: hypothetical protein ACM3PX_07790 [Omnitrophica WOR_2 bacterium]|jgi:predicted nucleic acid-binding protein